MNKIVPDSLLCSNRVGGTWLNLIKDLICDKPTHYGKMGCQVSKGGIENQIDFWPRIKILVRKNVLQKLKLLEINGLQPSAVVF